MKMENGKQQPLKRFKAGPVSAALWENRTNRNGRIGVIMKATVSRNYRDKDGNWRASSSFARDEIQLAIHCLNQAYAAIVAEQNVGGGPAVVQEEAVV